MHYSLLPEELRRDSCAYKANLVGCAWQSFYVKQIQDGHLALQPTPICRLYAWPAHKRRPGVCPPHPALRTAEAARLSAQLPWHTSCRCTASCSPLRRQRLPSAVRDDDEESGPLCCIVCIGGNPCSLKTHCPVHILATWIAPCNSVMRQGCHTHCCACLAASKSVTAASQLLGRHSLTLSCPRSGPSQPGVAHLGDGVSPASVILRHW